MTPLTMKKSLSVLAILFLIGSAFGQTPKVPDRLQFGDITLKISESAKTIIQKDVDLLTKSPKYFEIKAERARSYFPIIERIFQEEGVPDEFKYLVLQESALISDAVSSAQAVGFWQMKDFTALELGLRVDRNVDERMNIIAATHGAARYFKKANLTFDNWLNALQSYQMGIGGATNALGDKYKGDKVMSITPRTYWYVRKFIAHMVAFEGKTDQTPQNPITEYKYGSGKSIQDISRETNIDYEQIKELNKWLIKGKIPSDRPYIVILPGKYKGIQDVVMENPITTSVEEVKHTEYVNNSGKFPEIMNDKYKKHQYVIGVNGLPGIIASNTDNAVTLSKKGSISIEKFLKYNDLTSNNSVKPGQVYYLKRKKRKAATHYHTYQPGESLWAISQKYGIRMDKLIEKNRITSADEVKAGRVLWLRYIRPADIDVEYSKIDNNATPSVPVVANSENSKASSKNDKKVIAETKKTSETPNQKSNSQAVQQKTSVENDTQTVRLEEAEFSDPELDPADMAEATDHIYSTEGKKKITHKVVKGETYYSIASKYDVPVPALIQWNNKSISDKIFIGDLLTLYVSPTEGFVKHIVKKGETMYKIAQYYGVSVDQILKWNNKVNYHLTVGEELKIKP